MSVKKKSEDVCSTLEWVMETFQHAAFHLSEHPDTDIGLLEGMAASARQAYQSLGTRSKKSDEEKRHAAEAIIGNATKFHDEARGHINILNTLLARINESLVAARRKYGADDAAVTEPLPKKQIRLSNKSRDVSEAMAEAKSFTNHIASRLSMYMANLEAIRAGMESVTEGNWSGPGDLEDWILAQYEDFKKQKQILFQQMPIVLNHDVFG